MKSPSKSIDTLLEDIGEVLTEGLEGSPEEYDKFLEFGRNIAHTLFDKITRSNYQPTLRMSNIGTPDRKLWYSINAPHLATPHSASTKMKFLYGDMVEEITLFLADLAGHKVEGQQDEMDVDGIKGHRDAVIDGVLIDVKSASTFGFKKFKDGKLADDDAFGYLPQIQNYLDASQDCEAVKEKDRAAFLAVDKQHGHMCLDFHDREDHHEVSLRKMIAHKREMLDGPLPERCFKSIPDGKSGNMKLGVQCSYCDWKNTCWPSLRTFIYSSGPRFLTRVVRTPDVPEAT